MSHDDDIDALAAQIRRDRETAPLREAQEAARKTQEEAARLRTEAQVRQAKLHQKWERYRDVIELAQKFYHWTGRNAIQPTFRLGWFKPKGWVLLNHYESITVVEGYDPEGYRNEPFTTTVSVPTFLMVCTNGSLITKAYKVEENTGWYTAHVKISSPKPWYAPLTAETAHFLGDPSQAISIMKQRIASICDQTGVSWERKDTPPPKPPQRTALPKPPPEPPRPPRPMSSPWPGEPRHLRRKT